MGRLPIDVPIAIPHTFLAISGCMKRNLGMTESGAIDQFLASCVRAVIRGSGMPKWPAELNSSDQAVAARISYHGIALMLFEDSSALAGWPDRLIEAVQDEARMQAMWEVSHSRVMARLVEALHNAGYRSVLMKGSALAYSVYADPAVRRRGDSDLLVETGSRRAVRKVLAQLGFEPTGGSHAVQESWQIPTDAGFSHEVDLHWMINGSVAVSQALELSHPRKRAITMPRLSPNAWGTAPVDTFIHICINRASHEAFGYRVGDSKLFEGDRLIWAVDLDRIASILTPEEWDMLIAIARKCKAADLVKSGLDFARRSLGTLPPERVTIDLADSSAQGDAISVYFRTRSASERLRADVQAAQDWRTKLTVIKHQVFPGKPFIRERYPLNKRWPVAALYTRRLIGVGARFLLGSAR